MLEPCGSLCGHVTFNAADGSTECVLSTDQRLRKLCFLSSLYRAITADSIKSI